MNDGDNRHSAVHDLIGAFSIGALASGWYDLFVSPPGRRAAADRSAALRRLR